MSAEKLRRAAARIAELAEAATPGSWSDSYGPRENGRVWADEPDELIAVIQRGGMTPKGTHPDAAYIAAMDPRVGLALADWLDAAARDADAVGEDRDADAVADLILGGAS